MESQLQVWNIAGSPDLLHGSSFVSSGISREEAELTQNILSSRQEWFERMIDRRRNINDECGYPREMLSATQFQRLYQEDPIAGRVCEYHPLETWKISPKIWDSNDDTVNTPFEQAWDSLGSQLRGEQSWYKEEWGSPVWHKMLLWDVLSRIGRFGVMVYGLEGGGSDLSKPVTGIEEKNSSSDGYGYVSQNGEKVIDTTKVVTTNKRNRDKRYELVNNIMLKPTNKGRDSKTTPNLNRVLYLRCFSEAQTYVTMWERNKSSPRYGLPTMYNIALADPVSSNNSGPSDSIDVHWTRVLHLPSDGAFTSSLTDGIPAIWPVYRPIYNLQKIYGASGEGYWRAGLPLLFLETPPAIAGAKFKPNLERTRNMMEDMMNGLQKWGVLENLSPKSIAPALVDPQPHAKTQLEAICIKLHTPMRKFMGSERGDLASSQDDGDWNDTVRSRQSVRAVPAQLVPFVDRSIMLGLLPVPEEDHYYTGWDDVETLTPKEKAGVFVQRMTGLGNAISLGVDQVMAPVDILTREMGYTNEEAGMILDNATQYTVETQALQEALGIGPDGFPLEQTVPPEDPAIGGSNPKPKQTSTVKKGG